MAKSTLQTLWRLWSENCLATLPCAVSRPETVTDVVLCCSFRTLVRARRKRRSTAGYGGFYVIFASVRRVSRHHGVGWGSDDVPLDLITVLMLRHGLGWGGVGQ